MAKISQISRFSAVVLMAVVFSWCHSAFGYDSIVDMEKFLESFAIFGSVDGIR